MKILPLLLFAVFSASGLAAERPRIVGIANIAVKVDNLTDKDYVLAGGSRTAIAMGNSGDRKFLPTLEKLTDDEDAAVAESARWALNKLRS